MTNDEARIAVLEFALETAQNRVEFLHNCLTHPKYSYGDPEATLRDLEEWEGLNPRLGYCHHSVFNKDCDACQYRTKQMGRYYEAREVLGLDEKENTPKVTHTDLDSIFGTDEELRNRLGLPPRSFKTEGAE